MSVRTKPFEDGVIKGFHDPNGLLVFDYQPGNGTRYVISITTLDEVSPEARDLMGLKFDTVGMLCLHNMGSHRWLEVPDSRGTLMLSDVIRQLGLEKHVSDALVVAEFAAHVCACNLSHPATEETVRQFVNARDPDMSGW